MNSRSKYAILLISSVLVVYAIVGGMLGRVSAQSSGSYAQLSVFMEVLSHIQNDYVDEPSIKDAITGAVRGLLETVDPYAGYLSPKEVAFYKDYNPVKSPAIGAVLARRGGYPVIVATLPGGPADKAGLGWGDFIESIDGVTTREMNIVQVESLLAAPAGKPVNLSVIHRRKSDPEPVTVNRDSAPQPPVESKMVESNIAYLKVQSLAPGKAADAKKQLDALLKKGAVGVVLDLRLDANGDEQEAVQLANLFIDSGAIGYVQGQKVEKRIFNANPKDAITKLPVVAIINQGTAGPAEIVAGALEDDHRGQVVGARTFGAGSVQKLLPMEDGWGLVLSVAKYYTPNGTEIQESGVKPTVEVLQASEEPYNPDSETEIQPRKAQTANEEDRQLKKAIEILKDPSKAGTQKAGA